jgi:lysophospholipase L1-like esterase
MPQKRSLFPALLLAAAALAQTPATSFKFDFGSGKPAPGYIQILPTTMYTDELGYGFEPGFISTGKPPFYFSVKAPEEGNYKVTVTFGDSRAESTTTVKAELRRLMVEKVRTAPGKFETRTFIVNVRGPRISTGGEVRLKDREKTSEAWAWDDKLTLEFTNARPAVGRIEIGKADRVPTLYIAGDSTSTDQPREPFNSWGQMLPRFFKPDIAIANHGESGESLRGFIGEGRLDKVMGVIRPGDYLLVQMGHNDQKEKGEGVGAFTTYKADLKRFIAEARRHGATPILVTPVNRLTFDAEGKITNSLGDYPEAVRQAGAEENVAVIDLNAMSKPFYEALGPVEAHKAFAGNDTTHHDNYGSYELAKCVVQAVKDNQLPLARFLVNDVPPFDPAHPDPIDKFDVPAERPYGGPFEPTWESIQANYKVPRWFRDGKFGIFLHWGLYAVPAHQSEWYVQHMYGNPEIISWHKEHFGPQDKFGYKDFIPLFTCGKYDPDAWAELFRKAGARYVVPTAEHHDGFAMWDSALTKWNAKQMGPKRDLIGDLATAVRKQGLKFGVSNHRMEHFTFIRPPAADLKTDVYAP